MDGSKVGAGISGICCIKMLQTNQYQPIPDQQKKGGGGATDGEHRRRAPSKQRRRKNQQRKKKTTEHQAAATKTARHKGLGRRKP